MTLTDTLSKYATPFALATSMALVPTTALAEPVPLAPDATLSMTFNSMKGVPKNNFVLVSSTSESKLSTAYNSSTNGSVENSSSASPDSVSSEFNARAFIEWVKKIKRKDPFGTQEGPRYKVRQFARVLRSLFRSLKYS